MVISQNKLIQFRNQNGFPPTICIQLLNWCNLKCTYCRSNSSSRMKDILDFESLKPLLIELREYGKWRISLTGGEPFFWEDIRSLLILLYDLDFDFSITTNAFASKSIFDTIPAYVWEKCTLYVSIDGNAKTHNNFRGNKSYENAIEFIEYAKPKAKRLFVNTVLFTNPKLWALELYKTLNELNVTNWTIISPVKKGRWHQEVLLEQSYIEQYNFIKSIANSSTTSSFLNFADTDSLLTDIVFIDSDNTIRLPGYFENNFEKKNPLSIKVNMNDNEIISKIIESVNNFILSENYIL
jgi:MoaA/NifB/PqqE/SkfB family radical SAM enzyme